MTSIETPKRFRAMELWPFGPWVVFDCRDEMHKRQQSVPSRNKDEALEWALRLNGDWDFTLERLQRP